MNGNNELIAALLVMLSALLTVYTLTIGYIWKQQANSIRELVAIVNKQETRLAVVENAFHNHEEWHADNWRRGIRST